MGFLKWLATPLFSKEPTMSTESLGPKPIVHQAAPKVAAANTVAPPIPAATEPAAHVGLVGNVEAVIEHALHPTASAATVAAPATAPAALVAPAQPAAATASLDALAQEVQTRLANHQTYKAQLSTAKASLASAQASHDTALAAMKANAGALATAQTNLATAVAADTATVNAAVTDANAAA